MDLVETVFSSKITDKKLQVNAWDIHTGSLLSECINSQVTSKGRYMMEVRNGLIFGVVEGSPLFQVWPLNKRHSAVSTKIIAPGKINAFAISPDMKLITLCIKEKIYFYQVESSHLLSIGSGHFQNVTIVKYNNDGSLVGCGGNDGIVTVWNMGFVGDHCSVANKVNESEPLLVFSNHTLPVTDLVFTSGILKSYLISVSEDNSAKIYDIKTGSILLSIAFDCVLKCLALPNTETEMYIGQVNGSIVEVSLLPKQQSLHIQHSESETSDPVFKGHTLSVNCLIVTLDGIHLISGSIDMSIRIWHITSRQCIRKIIEKAPIDDIVLTTLPKVVFECDSKPVNLKLFKEYMFRNNKDETEFELITSNIPTELSNVEAPKVFIKERHSAKLKATNDMLYKFCVNKLFDRTVFAERSAIAKRKKIRKKVANTI